MRMKLGKLSLFYRYLFSYALLLILPILVTGFFVYQYFVGMLQTQVLQSNHSMLEQVRDTMDSQLLEMKNIAIQLSNKREFDPDHLGQAYAVYEAKEKISLYAEANTFFTEVAYKAHGIPLLISSKSTYLLPVFHHIYLMEQLDYGQFEEMLKTSEIHVQAAGFMEGELDASKDLYISYTVPVPKVGSFNETKGILIYLIKEKEIRRMLESFLPYEKSNVYIVDQYGQLITSLSNKIDLPKELLHSELELNGIRQLGGEPYYVSRITSPSSGWTYITVVSETQLMKPVNELKYKATIVLLLILIIGSSIIYINMHVHYNPLRRLIGIVDEKLRLTEWNSYQGLDKLRSAFDYMSNRSLTLEKEVELSKAARRQQLLTQLLQGQTGNEEDFRQSCEELGIRLRGEYRVVCMEAHPCDRTDSTNALAALSCPWRMIVSDEIDMYQVETIQLHRWIWIQAVSEHEAWSVWHKQLDDATGMAWTIGVGEVCNELIDLPKSYINALTALQFHLIVGSDRVILPDQLTSREDKFSAYPARELEMLSFHIREGDLEQVRCYLGGMLKQIRARSKSLLSAKYIYFDLIHTILKAVSNENIHQGVSISYPDIIELTQCTSYRQMDAIVWTTLDEITPMLEKEKKLEDNVLLHQIIELLHDKYSDSQFSIQSMANHFSQSSSYLSRYFKEHTGRTVLEYLNGIRIDEAKRLLIETKLTVTEIVQRIGYSDPSSFIRKFKSELQLTPGEYRKRMQKQHERLPQ
ncbi:helix-turn-helix domain-containing protein [Paenibacillus sp. MB22_1]|uniref:helix-turn-helix domain-containing protein n=1 Tax=Paenibacillus sp. MB22_1 TaxID=3383121 RepID=UPI0039A04934